MKKRILDEVEYPLTLSFSREGVIYDISIQEGSVMLEQDQKLLKTSNLLDLFSSNLEQHYFDVIDALIEKIKSNDGLELVYEDSIVQKSLVITKIDEHSEEGDFKAEGKFIITERLNDRQSVIDGISELVPGAFFKIQISQNGKNIIKYLSSGITDITGYSKESYLNGELKYFVHPNDHFRLDTISEQISNVNQFVNVEFRTYKIDGTPVWVEAKAKSHVNNAGYTYFTGSLNEITIRKNFEERSIALNNRMFKFFELSNDAYWDWDLTDDSCYYSKGYQKLFGYDTQAPHFHYSNWRERIHPEDQDALNKILKDAITNIHTDDFWSMKYRYRTADNDFRTVEAKGLVIRNNDRVAKRMIGVLSDVTSRDEREAKCRETEIRLEEKQKAYDILNKKYQTLKNTNKSFFDHSPIAKIIYNSETDEIIRVNAAAKKIYGYAEEEFFSMTLCDLASNSEKNKATRSALQFIRHGTYYPENIQEHVTKNGEKIYVELRESQIHQDNSKAKLCSIFNVTDTIVSTTMLEEQNEKLKNLAWLQSHEVRAPLANIMGVVDLINSTTENKELLNYAEMLQESANKLDNTIRKVLEYTSSPR